MTIKTKLDVGNIYFCVEELSITCLRIDDLHYNHVAQTITYDCTNINTREEYEICESECAHCYDDIDDTLDEMNKRLVAVKYKGDKK